MVRAFSSPLKSVRSRKSGYITRQLDYILKTLRRKFDFAPDIEEERKSALEQQRELAAGLKFKRSSVNTGSGYGYLTF